MNDEDRLFDLLEEISAVLECILDRLEEEEE